MDSPHAVDETLACSRSGAPLRDRTCSADWIGPHAARSRLAARFDRFGPTIDGNLLRAGCGPRLLWLRTRTAIAPVPNPAAARLFGAARSVGRVAIRDFFFTGLGRMDTGSAGAPPFGYAPDIFQSRSGHPIGPRGQIRHVKACQWFMYHKVDAQRNRKPSSLAPRRPDFAAPAIRVVVRVLAPRGGSSSQAAGRHAGERRLRCRRRDRWGSRR